MLTSALLAGPAPADERVISPDDARLVNQGRSIYTRSCVFCHGRTGNGNGPWAAGVDAKPRNFRSGVFKFRSIGCGGEAGETGGEPDGGG